MVASGVPDPRAGLMGKQVIGGHNRARSSVVRCPEHPQNISEPSQTHTAVPDDTGHPDVK